MKQFQSLYLYSEYMISRNQYFLAQELFRHKTHCVYLHSRFHQKNADIIIQCPFQSPRAYEKVRFLKAFCIVIVIIIKKNSDSSQSIGFTRIIFSNYGISSLWKIQKRTFLRFLKFTIWTYFRYIFLSLCCSIYYKCSLSTVPFLLYIVYLIQHCLSIYLHGTHTSCFVRHSKSQNKLILYSILN